jgi:hypothetical protein
VGRNWTLGRGRNREWLEMICMVRIPGTPERGLGTGRRKERQFEVMTGMEE